MSERIDVFVSSTSKDLIRYRQHVDDVLMKIGMHPIMMEDFTPSDRNALQVCYDRVVGAEVFVGIYAHRYGYIPGSDSKYKTISGEVRTGNGKTGVTEWEYRWAKERGIPIRLFVLADVYPPGHEQEGEPVPWPPLYVDDGVEKVALQAFKTKVLTDHVVSFFYSPEDLASKAAAALVDIQQELGKAKPSPGVRTRAEFYKHIPMPTNYVPRPELIAALRGALLGDSDVAFTSAIPAKARGQSTALHGMGGIGKSVMARVLCDDSTVQAAFSDGILWTTLGQELTESDIIKKLREWMTTLGGQITENAPSTDTLKNTLVKLLEDRACLLVIDDLWRRKDAEWFKVGGPKCRMLITTRDAEVARLFGASVTPIPLMPLGEAVQLLEEWAEGQLTTVDLDVKAIIAQRVGRLPLALKLAGAQLARKTPDAWLRSFDARRLKTSRPEGDIHDSLEKTFGLSIDQLEETEQRLYSALVIFKEDEQIHEAGILKLWQELASWDADTCEETLRDLAARALLELVNTEFPHAVVLHDLLRDLMAAGLTDKGIRQDELHYKLVDAYRRTQTGQGWATAPDDGYLYDHLAYHLKAMHDYPELKKLFDNHDWLHTRIPQNDYTYDGYISDLMIAWCDFAALEAQRQIDAGEDPLAFADCIRYALIRTSLNSLAGNYVPELVVRTVETGVWSTKRALGIAAHMPDAKQQAKLYTLLLATSKLETEEEEIAQTFGLSAALASGAWSCAEALAALAPYLHGEAREQALTKGLSAALAIQDEGTRARALTALALHLSGETREQALAQALRAALAIRYAEPRAKTLAALALHLSEDAHEYALEQALQAALAVEKERTRVRTLASLAPQLSGMAHQQALAQGMSIALAIQDEGDRARALAALAPHLSGDAREQALAQGMSIALAIQDEGDRARALAALVPFVSEEAREQALTQALSAALATKDEGDRAWALAALAPHLSGEAREQALARCLSMTTTGRAVDRAGRLIDLAPYLSEEALIQGLSAVFTIGNELYRAEALEVLAPYLSGEALTQALSAALAIQDDRDERSRAEALAALAVHLSGEAREQALTQALSAAHAIQDERSRAEALAALAVHLSGEAREQALTQALSAAHADKADYLIAKTVAALAPYLSGESLTQGLNAALSIQDEGDRADALTALAPQLSGEAREQVLAQAMTAALASQYYEDRAKALAALAFSLSAEAREQALAEGLHIALAVEDGNARVRALAALAPQLSGEVHEQALAQALRTAFAVEDGRARVFTLAALAPHLSAEAREQALAQALSAAHAVEDEGDRVLALALMIPYLSGTLLIQGLRTALAIEEGEHRARVLVLFLELPVDQPTIIRNIRQALLSGCLGLQRDKRQRMLWFYADEKLFASPILSTGILEAITCHIIEICTEWQWV